MSVIILLLSHSALGTVIFFLSKSKHEKEDESVAWICPGLLHLAKSQERLESIHLTQKKYKPKTIGVGVIFL
jgi:hypothetical protein